MFIPIIWKWSPIGKAENWLKEKKLAFVSGLEKRGFNWHFIWEQRCLRKYFVYQDV